MDHSRADSKAVIHEQDEAYRNIVTVENAIDEMTESWKEMKKLDMGYDPNVVIRMHSLELERLVLIPCYDSSGFIGRYGEACRKRQYMRLIGKYGLAAALLKTGCFTKTELREMQEKKNVGSTVLFKRSIL